MFKRLIPATLLIFATSNTAIAGSNDEREVLNVINNVGYFADQLDWDNVADQFHPNGAVLDYTNDPASAGSLPKTLPADIVVAWKGLLPGFDRTHHMIGTEAVYVNRKTATTTSNVYATHFIGDNYWVFIGDYQHELVKTQNGWKITLMRANLRAQLGDETLPEQAATRVASGQ